MMREDAASFMARNKAELKAVRARQRREPKVALRSPEDIETERREREAAFDARHWTFMDGNFIHKEQPPKPKDTHKQSTLPECMSSAQSAKSVRHASPAMKAQKQDDGKLSNHLDWGAPSPVPTTNGESASLVLLFQAFSYGVLAQQLVPPLRECDHCLVPLLSLKRSSSFCFCRLCELHLFHRLRHRYVCSPTEMYD
jgi:hypothetical protein